MLSELAIDNPEAFKDLVQIAKDALDGKSYVPAKKEVKEEKRVNPHYSYFCGCGKL